MKKILAVFLLSIFIFSAFSCTALGLSVTGGQTLGKASEIIQQRPGGGGRDKTPPTVEILSPSEGETVSEKITISARATDNVGVKTVEYSIDGGAWNPMTLVEGSTKDGVWNGAWDTNSVYDGEHKITVKATDASKNVGEDSTAVTTDNGNAPPPAPPYDYELFIEIDYIGSHEPTPGVLTYIHDYYYARRIGVTFYAENVTLIVTGLGINYADGINDNEFWNIEAACNDLGDDNKAAYNDPNFGTDGVYSSKWKWVLFGTSVEGEPYVVGYCYIVMQKVGLFKYDLLAGNYMFIADETADDWAADNGIAPYGAEAVVLMHEMGHSIGIGILDWRGNEVYCGNPECAMSYLSVYNADNYNAWFYCEDHWATRNMKYYIIG